MDMNEQWQNNTCTELCTCTIHGVIPVHVYFLIICFIFILEHYGPLSTAMHIFLLSYYLIRLVFIYSDMFYLIQWTNIFTDMSMPIVIDLCFDASLYSNSTLLQNLLSWWFFTNPSYGAPTHIVSWIYCMSAFYLSVWATDQVLASFHGDASSVYFK